jgi:hypothetical protein
VEEDLARLRETAADLRRRIGEREDEPTDPAERSALIEQAEEQEALIDMLNARREGLLRELGRPGTGTGPVDRPLLSDPGLLDPDRGEWQGNVARSLPDNPAADRGRSAAQRAEQARERNRMRGLSQLDREVPKPVVEEELER